MKLNKGYLFVACSARTSIILQELMDKGKFDKDPVSFVYNISCTDGCRINGDIFEIIVTCLKGSKWSGYSILDSEIETWIERVLGGEIIFNHSDVQPCPI